MHSGIFLLFVQLLSVTPRTAACQGSLFLAISWSLTKFMSIESVMPSSHLILCCPLLLPSMSPNIRVFSNESALCIRWSKYWSFSFSISPSSEHPGLISFRMDWLDLLAVQGTLKSLLQHHNLKASIPQCIWGILNGRCLSVTNIIHSIKCSKIIKNQKINIKKEEIL